MRTSRGAVGVESAADASTGAAAKTSAAHTAMILRRIIFIGLLLSYATIGAKKWYMVFQSTIAATLRHSSTTGIAMRKPMSDSVTYHTESAFQLLIPRPQGLVDPERVCANGFSRSGDLSRDV